MVINKRITKKMIREGLKKGIIKITTNDIDYIVCEIGDFQFYFTGGLYNAKDIKNREIAINDIYNTLREFKYDDTFEDEYLYYYFFLKENL